MALERDKQIIELINKSKKILICFNSHYTIDSVASASLLAHYLKSKNKEYTIVCDGFSNVDQPSFLTHAFDIKTTLENPQKCIIRLDIGKSKIKEFSYDVDGTHLNIYITPENGTFDHEKVKTESSGYAYDLIITLDTVDLQSLGSIYKDHVQFFYDIPILNIDHNASNELYGQVNMVDMTAVSVTEMLYNFFKKEDASFLEKDHLTSILAGIIHKTHSFRNEAVTPKSLHMASELMEKGAEKEHIIKHLYQRKDINLMKVWGKLLSQLSTDDTHGIIYSHVETKDLKGITLDSSSITDIVNELLIHIPGARVILLTYEREVGSYHHILWTSEQYDPIKLVQSFNPRLIKGLAYFKIKVKSLKESEKQVLDSINKKLSK